MQPTTDAIFAALRTCRTPEIPVDFGDPGLSRLGSAAQRTGRASAVGRSLVRKTDCPRLRDIVGPVRCALLMLAASSGKIACGPIWYPGFTSEEGRSRYQPAA